MSALVPPFRTTVEGRGAKRREGRAAWRRRQTLLHENLGEDKHLVGQTISMSKNLLFFA